MKSIKLLIGLSFMLGLYSCKQDFKRLGDSETDLKKIQIAKEFSEKFYTELKNGSYYQFHDEATNKIKSFLTEEKQKSTYKYLKSRFGDFQSLEYAETWIKIDKPNVHIIRFKSDFDRMNKKIEIRVILSESDKIMGFWIKPWSDMLQLESILDLLK